MNTGAEPHFLSLLHGPGYALWTLTCPMCLNEWEESTHELWNVCALTCPGCLGFLVLHIDEFHGDSNYTGENY